MRETVDAGDYYQTKVTAFAEDLAPGQYSCELVIHSNDADDSPWIVPVDLTVTSGRSMSASPSPLVFDTAPVNQTTCDTIYVANNGAQTCTIAEILGCSTAPFSVDTTMTVHSLAAGDTTKIAVCVTPTTEGSDSALVSIVSDAAESPVTVSVRLDVVTAANQQGAPVAFRIVSLSPNPFNPSTTVNFTLPRAMPVTAEIWSVKGERVRTLSKERRFGSGANRITWNGLNDQGLQVASGVYLVRLKTNLGSVVARAVLLK
jgi:hypothetical protein